MRKLMFRAWDAKAKKWYYFTGIFNKQPWIERSTFPQYESFPELIPMEVMQYTGLRDKNGKEIYEGDIISGLVVTYCGDQGEGLGMNAGWYLQKNDFGLWTELESRIGDNNYEVIGNIYENPKLPKEVIG